MYMVLCGEAAETRMREGGKNMLRQYSVKARLFFLSAVILVFIAGVLLAFRQSSQTISEMGVTEAGKAVLEGQKTQNRGSFAQFGCFPGDVIGGRCGYRATGGTLAGCSRQGTL